MRCRTILSLCLPHPHHSTIRTRNGSTCVLLAQCYWSLHLRGGQCCCTHTLAALSHTGNTSTRARLIARVWTRQGREVEVVVGAVIHVEALDDHNLDDTVTLPALLLPTAPLKLQQRRGGRLQIKPKSDAGSKVDEGTYIYLHRRYTPPPPFLLQRPQPKT